MLYLSKGLLLRQSDRAIAVSHLGQVHELEYPEARDWLAGHTEPKYLCRARLSRLIKLGLVETQPGESFHVEIFRMLSNSTLVPRKRVLPYLMLSAVERRLLRWISEAGLRLTAAELVKLCEADETPREELLGVENRQRLVERIYTRDSILDGALESAMERSSALEATVKALLSLLKKKRLIVI